VFQDVKFADLSKLLDIAVEKNKYLFIHDKTNQGETFFKYSGAILCNFAANMLKTEMKELTIKDTMEDLRKQCVLAMMSCKPLVIALDKFNPDFSSTFNSFTSAADFQSHVAFDYPEWSKRANFMKIVRKEEDHDKEG